MPIRIIFRRTEQIAATRQYERFGMVRPSGFEPPTFCSGGKIHSANPFVFGKFMSVQRTNLGAFGAIWVGIWVGTRYRLQVNPLPDDMGDLAWAPSLGSGRNPCPRINLSVPRGSVSPTVGPSPQHQRAEPSMVVSSTSMTSSCAWMRTPLTTPCKGCSTLGCSIHLRPQAGHRFERGPVVGLEAQGFFVFPHRLPPPGLSLVNAA